MQEKNKLIYFSIQENNFFYNSSYSLKFVSIIILFCLIQRFIWILSVALFSVKKKLNGYYLPAKENVDILIMGYGVWNHINTQIFL